MITDRTLTYRKKPIRVRVCAAGAFYAAHDIYLAHRRRVDRKFLSRFDPAHLRLETFMGDDGPIKLTAVTCLGVATIATDVGAVSDRMLDGWVRRNSAELADEFGFGPLGLTLCANGTLPAKPLVSHDRYEAWKNLRDVSGPIHLFPSNLHEPALFDEDPILGAHDPDGDAAKAEAQRAAAEEYMNQREAPDGPTRWEALQAKVAGRRWL
ncbi:hypothetical protein [Sphingomonas sp.]|uniref:hypothetical protein n=1 Tax=Sphingomonas sp. TaxID=28214 RepID=UPI002FDA98D8